jgi:hypothetical protein
MSGILTPGYLRWDGTKYVLDHDVEIVGPPGTAGPVGPVGPAGPPGPFGIASGDLLGTYPGPMSVVGLTGVLGVVSFGGTITNPTITQTATGATTGQTMTLKAQGAASIGGNVVLQSGTGSTAGIIQFTVGNSNAGQIDSAGRLRVGPSSSGTFNIFTSTPLPGATNYIFSNNAAGRNVTGTYSGVSNDFAATETINYSGGGTGTVGMRVVAGGSAAPVGAWQSNGAIDQIGSATSALVFTTTTGAGGITSVTGRVFQSGAWTLGDLTNSSSTAQAGLTGAVLNFATVGGSLTTTSGQALIYNTNASPNFGNLNLQGNATVNTIAGLTTVTTSNSTKFINLLGRTHKLVTTTTSPYNVLATDELVSIGTITAQSTTIAAGSNGASLPQATINVASTTGFPTSGFILVVTSNGAQVVQYTNVSGGNQFTGCTGGTGTMSTGGAVSSLFTVNLPAAPATGDIYVIKDANGSAGASNILINGNGKNIDGSATLLVMTNFTQASLVYNGTGWISALSTNIAPNSGYTSVVNVVSGATATVVGFDQLVLCDPTSSGCTVFAPANPVINMRFTVKDATATASVGRPITVNGNGKSLENPANPGTYTSPITITAPTTSVTWAFDPVRLRYTIV